MHSSLLSAFEDTVLRKSRSLTKLGQLNQNAESEFSNYKAAWPRLSVVFPSSNELQPLEHAEMHCNSNTHLGCLACIIRILPICGLSCTYTGLLTSPYTVHIFHINARDVLNLGENALQLMLDRCHWYTGFQLIGRAIKVNPSVSSMPNSYGNYLINET